MQVCNCRLVWCGNRSLKVLLIHRFVYINSFVLLDQLVTPHHLSISITAEDAKAAARQRLGLTWELDQLTQNYSADNGIKGILLSQEMEVPPVHDRTRDSYWGWLNFCTATAASMRHFLTTQPHFSPLQFFINQSHTSGGAFRIWERGGMLPKRMETCIYRTRLLSRTTTKSSQSSVNHDSVANAVERSYTISRSKFKYIAPSKKCVPIIAKDDYP